MKKSLSLLLSAGLLLALLSGCGGDGATLPPPGEEQPGENLESSTAPAEDPAETQSFFALTDGDMFTDRDRKTGYDKDTAVAIQLQVSAATVGEGVNVAGSTVEITKEGDYLLSGTWEGALTVNVSKSEKVHLIFAGVSIQNSTGAALYVLQGDKVFITLAEGTENSLKNGGSFSPVNGENVDAALYSKEDLSINGKGSLTVESPAGHGIAAKDDLVIVGGSLTVTAANHAIDANDSVRIAGAALTAKAGKDGIHCENSEDGALGYVYISGGRLQLQAEGDGISAGGYVHITGGEIGILAGGGYKNGAQHSSGGWGGYPGGGRPKAETTTEESSSMKGIKSGLTMVLAGGDITVDAADDALHSNTSLELRGGTYQIATGDDGVHADEKLTVAGGKMEISTSYEGLEAQHLAISGGEIRLNATDDGLNAAGGMDSSGTGGRDEMFGRPGGPGKPGGGNSTGSITISGGTLYIKASGDGIDANGTLEISGGHTTVTGPTQGDTATLDYDKSAIITGGTFIGTGAYTQMAQNFSDARQGVVAFTTGNQSAGTEITVKDSGGKVLFSFAPEQSFQLVILSSPELVSGETYTVSVGKQSADVKAD